MRIGQILVRDGAITDEQLHSALQVQTRFGGRLGTSLVELGYVDLDTLARALGRLHGVPPVLQKHLASLDPTVTRLLSARLAEHYGAVPLGNSARPPHRLIVAFREPSMKNVEEVAFATGKRVEPAVAPDLLIGKLLERLYGIKRRAAVPYVNADLGAAAPSATPEARRSPGTVAPPRTLETSRPEPPSSSRFGAAVRASLSPPVPSARPPSDAAPPLRHPTSVPQPRPSAPFSAQKPISHAAPAASAPPEAAPASSKPRKYASLPPALAHLGNDDPATVAPPSPVHRIPAAPPLPSFALHGDTPAPPSDVADSPGSPRYSHARVIAAEGPTSLRRPTAAPPAAPPTPAPTPPTAPSAPMVIEVPSAPRRPARSGPAVTIDIPVSSLPSVGEAPARPSAVVPAAPPLAAFSGPRPALGLNDAVEAIAHAKTRDDVGNAVVDYLRSTYGCGLVLIVKDEMALGWKGFAESVDDSLLEAISIPLGTPSLLNVAYASQAVFRGSPPNEGAALHSRLWKLLRAPHPREVIVAPVLLRERVVNLLYAHAIDGGILPTRATGDMTRIATAAAEGYAAVIRKK